MPKKHENYYFLAFVRLVEYTNKAAKLLESFINDYNPARLSEYKDKMHEIEHSADLEKHVLIEKLVKEFITPIDREDILSIAQKIDDVTDAIEDVLLRLYMFNVQEINNDAKEFTKIISQSTHTLLLMANELHNFKKSTTLKDAIIEVNRLEEVGDRLYIDAVRSLFISNISSKEIYIWEQMLYRFEKCCDACEDVADSVETIIMKNV